MAARAHDLYTKIAWTATVASVSAPTVANLTAGTDLSTLVAKDGLKVPTQHNTVDLGTIASNFDSRGPGTFGGDIEMIGFRDDTADTFWDLCVFGTVGYIIVRRLELYSGAWAASDKVEVYPVTMHQPVPMDTATNEAIKFKMLFPVRSTPELKAVVAA